MIKLMLGLVLFIGSHSVSIIANDWRNAMALRQELLWKIILASAAVAGVLLMSFGYAEARLTSALVYSTPSWMAHLAAVLLLPVFVLFFAPYFPGRIKSTLKHPQLVSVKLWAFAHLLVNGTVADLVLFGSLLAWAVVDRISLKRRTARPLPGAPENGLNDIIVIVLGLIMYVVFVLWLHRLWIGVAPFA